jgi:DNA-binding winged helix-turn-helix (wHTH) protein
MRRFRLGDWRVDASLNQIVRESDPDDVVRIEPKAMEVLAYLAERPGEVVDKESVIRDVWNGAFVTNEVLTNAIWELRRALGDDARSSIFIQTIPKRGYRLVAPVSPIDSQPAAGEISPTSKVRSLAPWILGLAAIGLGALAIVVLRPAAPSRPVTKFAVELPEPLAPFYLPTVAIAPDASRIVFATVAGLYVRSFDQLESRFLSGTEQAHGPFFAPDGESIGFFSGRTLSILPLDESSPPRALSDVGAPRGASWGSDGFVYFTPRSNAGLFRVPEEGGQIEAVTELDESRGEWTHRWPDVLPGANAILFTVARWDLTSFDDAEIDVLDLETRKRHVVVESGSFGRFFAGDPGWLLYVRAGELLAAPFDPHSLRTTGPPRTALEDVKLYPINGGAQLAVSRQGSLAYVPDIELSDAEHELVFRNRKGERSLVVRDERPIYDPSLSPGGSKLAVSMVTNGNSDLWIYDLARKTLTRLTTSGGEEEHPVFAPSGRELAYDYAMAGSFRIFSRPVDAGSGEREVVGSEYSDRPESFTPDGSRLVFSEEHPETGFNLWTVELEGSKRSPLLVTPFNERQARVSPDGRWLAYSSDESGRFEVYVTSLPEPGAKLQVSVHGGQEPRWTKGGREIVFLDGAAVQAVAITTDPELRAGAVEKLFDWPVPRPFLESPYRRLYDVTSDGERLLLVEAPEDPASRRLNVVLNWVQELAEPARR